MKQLFEQLQDLIDPTFFVVVVLLRYSMGI